MRFSIKKKKKKKKKKRKKKKETERSPECNPPTFGMKEGNVHSFIVYLMYLPKEKQFFIPY